MGTGLDDREICLGDALKGTPSLARGLDDRESLLGVAGGVFGGVAPFPLALDSPIALTSSFTDTPCNSGGISLDEPVGNLKI